MCWMQFSSSNYPLSSLGLVYTGKFAVGQGKRALVSPCCLVSCSYTSSPSSSSSLVTHTSPPKFFISYITILGQDPTRSRDGVKVEETVDLRTLRAIRVLRPLKLVSGVPSTYTSRSYPWRKEKQSHLHPGFLPRFAGCAQVDPEGLGAPHADRPPRHVRHPHLRHHRTGILLRSAAQDLLLHRRPG